MFHLFFNRLTQSGQMGNTKTSTSNSDQHTYSICTVFEVGLVPGLVPALPTCIMAVFLKAPLSLGAVPARHVPDLAIIYLICSLLMVAEKCSMRDFSLPQSFGSVPTLVHKQINSSRFCGKLVVVGWAVELCGLSLTLERVEVELII